jgi:hypothetical protein
MAKFYRVLCLCFALIALVNGTALAQAPTSPCKLLA